MVVGIFHTYLVLMAIVGTKQPSGKHELAPEEDTEIVQRMKEREETLRQHQLCLEQEIAELEARQESVPAPVWQVETRIQEYTGSVLGWASPLLRLAVPVLFMVWRQRRNRAPGQLRG
ncbi:inositol 1,4,5-trisphosphate receptor-interacting protein-like protein [Turdus rufiventris]|nr:inositol 1,4,5-trisphosphate receptor-interacting protein-like protein [Turdus rufiventris]